MCRPWLNLRQWDDILKGPLADAADGRDNDFVEPLMKQAKPTTCHTFCADRTGSGIGAFSSDPINEIDYYHYLSGKWLDGSRWTYGGNGHFRMPHQQELGHLTCSPGFPTPQAGIQPAE